MSKRKSHQKNTRIDCGVFLNDVQFLRGQGSYAQRHFNTNLSYRSRKEVLKNLKKSQFLLTSLFNNPIEENLKKTKE